MKKPSCCVSRWGLYPLFLVSTALSCLITCSMAGGVASSSPNDSIVGGASFLRRSFEGDQQHQQQLHHRQLQVPPYPRQYHIRSSQDIHDKLEEWKATYPPELVRVTTSQETFQLPAAGTEDDCPFYKSAGCPNYMVTIQDFIAHPEASYSSNRLPEVLWSGCLHGDERVGPTAVVEAADLLLAAASCEALPRYKNSADDGSGSKNKDQSYQQQLDQATKCRQALAEQGIDDAHRQWLARLVSTRRIIIVPTANALGYYRDNREENGVDPNRDFPFDLKDPTQCMQTIAGRTLNEIFREHLFQLSLTFHAGMEVVGYEWGAPSYQPQDSPDDTAQYQIAHAYSQFAGGWKGTTPYDSGPMNDLVYPVRGGMEDWAYAGSFDPQQVITCKPKTYEGYPPEKTKYNNATLRVFNMLVETSNDKTPSSESLGTNENVVMGTDLPSNGHVARNIRLALLAADLVEPYLSINQVNDVRLSDDIVPLTDLKQEPTKCQAIRSVQVPQSQSAQVNFQWTVGGALDIDTTAIYYAKWDALPEDALNCLGQPSLDLTTLMQVGNLVGEASGTGLFAPTGPSPTAATADGGDAAPTVLGPVFHGMLDLSSFAPGDLIAVVALARVDRGWTDQPTLKDSKVNPAIPPQSHIVNARTNPNWHFENSGKHVYGRLNWYSMPLTIVLGPDDDATVELSNRFAAASIQDHTTTTSSENGNNNSDEDESGKRSLRQMKWTRIVGLLLIVATCAATCAVFARSRQHKQHQRIVNELYDEENKFQNQQQHSTTNNNNYYADQIDENFDDDEEDDDGEHELELKLGQPKQPSPRKNATLAQNGEVELQQRYTID